MLMLPLTPALLFSCAGQKKTASRPEPNHAFAQADSLYASTPRTPDAVKRALELTEHSLRDADSALDRYARIKLAIRCALWLAYNSTTKNDKSGFANTAMQLAGKAIRMDDRRAEGYYYRAIAAGLLAQTNKLYGRQAMQRIRNDGVRAIELNEEYDHAGPHRLLGALYLRAPGPPAGLGSMRKAVTHLEKAHELAPGHPENLTFLAEAYLKLDKPAKARELVEQAIASDWPEGDIMSGEQRLQDALRLKQKIYNRLATQED